MGHPLVVVTHPRRGLLKVDEEIAPIVVTLWKLGIDVHHSGSCAGIRASDHHEGLARLMFRDRDIRWPRVDLGIRDDNPDLDLVEARVSNIGQRLLAMLEKTELDASASPHLRCRHRWSWTWDDADWSSVVWFPIEDLPLLTQLAAQVEKAGLSGGLGEHRQRLAVLAEKARLEARPALVLP
jgi:hypothetical protein